MDTKKSFEVLSLGEILLRLSPPSNERLVRGDSLRKQTGGAELNVASGIAMLGLRTGIISKIPDNDIGYFVKNYIRFCGVSDDYLVYDKSRNARLGIYFYEDGASPRKPAIVYDRQHSSIHSLSIEDIPQDIYGETRCFHTSGITLALGEEVRSCAIEMIRRFKAAGAMISFDVNFRANLWRDEAQARACIEQILPCGRVFLFGADGTDDLWQGWRRAGNHEELYQGLPHFHCCHHTADGAQPETAHLRLGSVPCRGRFLLRGRTVPGY